MALPEVPTAGILTTSAWLNRFPTTDTNRNRHRAWVLMRRFLATDILRLADRPVDPTSSQVFNPTMNDPQCTVCPPPSTRSLAPSRTGIITDGTALVRTVGMERWSHPPTRMRRSMGDWSRALPWFADARSPCTFPLAVTQLMFELFIGEELIILRSSAKRSSGSVRSKLRSSTRSNAVHYLEYEPQFLAGEVGAVGLFPG